MKNKNKLTRDSFLNSTKLKLAPVELGTGIVYVKQLSGKDMREYFELEASLKKKYEVAALDNAMQLELFPFMLSKSVCDEHGTLFCKDSEDVEKLMNLAMSDIQKLAIKIKEVSDTDGVNSNLKKGQNTSGSES